MDAPAADVAPVTELPPDVAGFLAVTPVPDALTKRQVVPKRFFSPALEGRFKLACAEQPPSAGTGQTALPNLPVKGLRTSLGAKRSGDSALMPPPPDAKTARLTVMQRVPTAMPAPGATAAAGADQTDVSGLDLLLFASEATPFKAALDAARGAVPGASPLGQLARLVDTSPYAVPGQQGRPGAAQAFAGARARPCKLQPGGASLTAMPSGVLQPLSVNAGHMPDVCLQTTASLVATMAPTAACHAAERWLDILAADLRARHAALRKSRGRISRAHASLCESRASGDTVQASVLLRQLDAALAGEEAALAARMKEVMDVRALCGVPEGELRIAGLKLKPSAPPAADSINASQAAASAAAVIFTAAAMNAAAPEAAE